MLHAQVPAAAPNLLLNGGFEVAAPQENLWEGVDRAGYLAGNTNVSAVLTTSGVIADTPMPLSVALADMNNDGLLDIVTIDPIGYLRIYFNHGTKQEPKFTFGELSFPFMAPTNNYLERRTLSTPRGSIVNSGTGNKDLIVGNYRGDIMYIHNDGTALTPAFKQFNDVAKMTIPTIKDTKHRWGNVFSPVMFDWDHDGKLDIILGEGSYSANNIHFLANQNSTSAPKFNEDKHSIIAYGDGREQLNLAIVDYQGTGKNDMLISDRTGLIGVYLNRSGNVWKPEDELSLDSFLKIGSSTQNMTFGGICTLAAGDLSGGGLFDLVVGKVNGRIAYVKNVGTKTAPKFEAPVELKGEAPDTKMVLPAVWDVDYGLKRGNFYGVAEVVNAADDKTLNPPEGKSALRLGYIKSPNTIIKAPYGVVAPLKSYSVVKKLPTHGELPSNGTPDGGGEFLANSPSNVYLVDQGGDRRLILKPGYNYTLSFRVKGTKARSCIARVLYYGEKKLGESKFEHLDRGGKLTKNEAKEWTALELPFSPGTGWSELKLDFNVKFNSRPLSEMKATTLVMVEFFIELEPEFGEVFLDDVKLIEKGKG
ncbi:MAG: VCBS repeat-containing protein [Chthoniobacterales bacterium]